MKKKIFLIILVSCLGIELNSQIISENFSSTFPAGWLQVPAASWTIFPALGNSNGSYLTTEVEGANSDTVSLLTQSFNASAFINYTVSFRAAVSKTNFVAPEIKLLYDAGNGPQFLADWSAGFNPNATYTINEGFDTQPPLNAENIFWENCTHTISAINFPSARFIFEIPVVNGGYMLIDDIVISGQPVISTDIKETKTNDLPVVFPNPVPQNGSIKISGQSINNVFLTDGCGKSYTLHYTTNQEEQEISLNGFAPGIYILRINKMNQPEIHKKLIIR